MLCDAAPTAGLTSAGYDQGVAPVEVLWGAHEDDDNLLLCVRLLEQDLVLGEGALQGWWDVSDTAYEHTYEAENAPRMPTVTVCCAMGWTSSPMSSVEDVASEKKACCPIWSS